MKRIAVMALLAGCGGRDVVITGGGPAQQPAHDDDGRLVIYSDRQVFCAVSPNLRDGMCFYDVADCERGRAAASNPYSPCAPRSAVACVDDTYVVSGHTMRACAPTIQACEDFLALARQSPDHRIAQERCEVQRYIPSAGLSSQ